MRRKDLVKTTMALTMAVFVSAIATGCSTKDVSSVPTDVIETVTEETLEEMGYKVIELDKPYDALVVRDSKVYDVSDAETEICDVTKDTYVTVYGNVEKDGIAVDFYAVELDNQTKGYIEGRNLDFNVMTEEDYADSLEEIEGGDGEESTEEVIEDVISESVVVEEEDVFEPYQMYTNTNCNVRAQASKDSELVGTCVINTEVKVIGIEGDWSKVEYNGLQAFIKSSLLSKDKTVVKQQSSNSGNGSGSSSGNSNSGGGASSGNPDLTSLYGENVFAGDAPTGGTTGHHSGGGYGGAY